MRRVKFRYIWINLADLEMPKIMHRVIGKITYSDFEKPIVKKQIFILMCIYTQKFRLEKLGDSIIYFDIERKTTTETQHYKLI